MFFGKLTVKQVLKSFSDKINSLKPPVYGFSNSFPYGLEESTELSSFDLVGFWVNRNSKMKKNSANFFFVCAFKMPLWIY